MQEDVVTVGVDLTKNVFHVHAITADGKVLVRRQLRRGEVLKFFSLYPPYLVGMEACALAHHWAPELLTVGQNVRLMPPGHVRPYVKRGKTDAADAEAICEAVTRPTIRFVAVKSVGLRVVLMLHKTRDLLMRQRTALINALNARFSKYKIVVSKGPGSVTALMNLLHEGQEDLPAHARSALQTVCAPLRSLASEVDRFEAQLLAWHRADKTSRRLASIPPHQSDHRVGNRRGCVRRIAVPLRAARSGSAASASRATGISVLLPPKWLTGPRGFSR